MTNEEKLKANIAAARLLGIKYYLSDNVQSLESDSVTVKRYDDTLSDIFTNPSDCLNVVKRLGDHLISFEKGRGKGDWFFWRDGIENKCSHKSFEEAVAVAVLEVVGAED